MPLAQHHQKMKMGRAPRAIFKRVRKCCILYNKNGQSTLFADQCCKMCNISGDILRFEAHRAQIVAQNATFLCL